MGKSDGIGNLIVIIVLWLGAMGLTIWLSVNYSAAAKITYGKGECFVTNATVVKRVDYWDITLTLENGVTTVEVTITETGNKVSTRTHTRDRCSFVPFKKKKTDTRANANNPPQYPTTRLDKYKVNNTYSCVYDAAKPISKHVWWTNPKKGILIALIIVAIFAGIPFVPLVIAAVYFGGKGCKSLVSNFQLPRLHAETHSSHGDPEVSAAAADAAHAVELDLPAASNDISNKPCDKPSNKAVKKAGFMDQLFSNPFKK
jgi:hypothetical protein